MVNAFASTTPELIGSGATTSNTAPSKSARLSIVINNYNYGRFLKEAIDSALAQTLANIEVIVVDDGSTDNSRNVIASYGKRIRAIYKKNGGQASALNVGFAATNGDVVIFLDSDDTLLPDTAQRVMDAFAQQPNLARVHYRMEVIDKLSQRTGQIKPETHIPLPSGDLSKHVLLSPDDMTWMATSGNAFSAQVLRQILPMPENEFRILADFFLTQITPLFGAVGVLEGTGACYRVHGANNHEVTQFDLNNIRRQIIHWRASHRNIHHFAQKLGHKHVPKTSDDIVSMSYIAHRIVSLKLMPSQHPIKTDTQLRLFLLGAKAAWQRIEISVFMRLSFITWLVTMLFARQKWAYWLSENFLFPKKRHGWVNRVLAHM